MPTNRKIFRFVHEPAEVLRAFQILESGVGFDEMIFHGTV
jgi:hypothetical protein